MEGKIAIVGSGDGILVFKAAGVATFPAATEKEAREALRKAAADYKVIFITEELAAALGDYLKRFDEEPYPVVLPVPSGLAPTGYGENFLKNAVERALGVDILGGE